MAYHEYLNPVTGKLTRRHYNGKRFPAERANFQPNSFTDLISALIAQIGSDAYTKWELSLPLSVKYDREKMTKAIQQKLKGKVTA